MKGKGFIKKALVYTVISATVAGNTIPALAYTNSEGKVNETQDVSTDDTAECEVYAELGTNFRVIIPKKITLSGSTKKGAYTVDVEGDIGGTDLIKVVPEESFTLTSTGLASQTATVSQDKTQWSCSEILPDSKTIGKGSISASGITAGAWNGSFWFNISLEEGTGSEGGGTETQSKLTLSESNVAMGVNDSVQVNAYLDGVIANDTVTWSSDNSNILVDNGLVETKASAQVGDTATITVTTNNTEELTTAQNILSDLGIVTYAKADDTLSASFNVTVIDMAYTATGEDEVITSLDIKAGESKNVEVTIIPASVSGIVSWSTTAPAGLNLVTNGNTVTLKVASDMTVGNTYNLVATYGNFSKLLKINIVSDEVHTHSYTGAVTTEATCTKTGVKTFTCECGDSYTETIPTTGHNYENGSCTECGEADPDYVTQEAGLYDANGNLLCTWANSGIDVETDYTYNNFNTAKTSPYYVLTNKYPTTKKVVIPNSVTSIGQQAFYKCESLTSVTIPNSVTSIGQQAFYVCKSLTSITIPDSVTSIGIEAFRQCESLTSITIPDSVTSIGAAAFSSCTSLTSVTIPDGITSIGNSAFSSCTSLTSVTIPNSVTSIGDSAFNNCAKLTSIGEVGSGASVEIPNSVTSIGSYAFSSCKSLTSVTIPNSVTSIGDSAFSYCTNLTSIEIPDGITSIGNRAFNNCAKLTSIGEVGSGASVEIPNSVTSIGSYAFENCKSLASVTIPDGVTSIGEYAFNGCTSLTSVTFKTTSGWYVGSIYNPKAIALSSADLANTSTAATYLKSTYLYCAWIRE